MGVVSAQRTSPSLVGRDDELTALGDAFERVRGGESLTLLVGGEAGIGKTRLVEEFRTRVQPHARIAIGQAVELGDEGPAFAPVVGILRQLLGEVGAAGLIEHAGPAASVLGRLLPELGTGGDSDSEGQGRVYEVVATLWEQIGRAHV